MKNELSKAYSCNSIVQENLIFSVPIYQRLFVWGEIQIEKLLNDIKTAAVCDAEGPYYVGVATVKKVVSASSTHWELVDGQQRSTFFSLYAAECLDLDPLDTRWNQFLFVGDQGNYQTRVRYIGREEDEKDLLFIAKRQYNQVLNPNFRVFHRVFDKWLRAMDKELARKVCDYVYNKVMMLFSELPQGYTPGELNLFFERMNAAGQQLGTLDIIKGRYFREAAPAIDEALDFSTSFKNTNENFDGRGTEISRRKLRDVLLDATPLEEERETVIAENRRSVLSPEVLLLHVLSLVESTDGVEKTTSRFDPKDIVERFDAYFNTEGPICYEEKRKSFLAELSRYRKFIDSNIIYINQEVEGSPYCFYKDESVEDEDSAEDNSNESESRISEKLRQFQSMMYVCHPNTCPWVLETYKEFRDKSVESVDRKELLAFLKKIDRCERLPTLNDLNYERIERKWFWRLDYILWEKLTEDSSSNTELLNGYNKLISHAIRKYTFRVNRSIEHLHPQTATDSERDLWQAKIDVTMSDSTTIENCFGNLAMISSSFNSTQSNDQINLKLARIKDQILEHRIESLKMLVMFCLAGGGIGKDYDVGSWRPEIAVRHGKDMYALLEEVYLNKGEVVQNV